MQVLRFSVGFEPALVRMRLGARLLVAFDGLVLIVSLTVLALRSDIVRYLLR